MTYSPVLALLGLFLVGAQAHMRFVCPRPESGDSGIKQGICSSEANPFELRYTDITPGPLTLHFEESVVHTGAPVRLALNKYGEDEGCMLLDQVPHNEQAEMDIGPDCWPFDWPISRCPAQHFVTVMIPDIECDQCYLQLVSVMTDKYTEEELPCWQENQATNNCSSYFSCANVKIRPTPAGVGKGIDTCRDYNSNLRGVWPYRPQDSYQVVLGEGEVGTANYDSHDSSLTVTVPSSAVNSARSLVAKVMHTAEGYEVSSGEVVAEGDNLKAVMTIPKDQVEDMASNQMELVLLDAAQRTQVATGLLALVKRNFEMDYYGKHGIDFTPVGWMQGDAFVGESATYPFALESAGKCMPSTQYYSAAVSNGEEAGVVTVTVSEYHGVVRGAFTGLDNIMAIKFSSGDSNVPDLDVPSVFLSGRLVQGMMDFSEAAEAGTFYNRVTITVSDGEGAKEFVMTLTEGISASLFDREEQFAGSASMMIGSNGQVAYTVVVPDIEGMTSMTLNGPARPGLVGPSFLDVTDMVMTGDGVFASGVAAESVAVLDMLNSGLMYVDVRTQATEAGNRGISGQASIPGQRSFSSQLSTEGGVVDISQPELLSNGAATFHLTRQGELTYRLTVRDTIPNELVEAVQLAGPSGDIMFLDATFTASDLEDKVFVASGTVVNPSSEILSPLASGRLVVLIYTDRYFVTPIYGTLPAITRSL